MSLMAFLANDVMSQKWKRIYDEHKFPFEVRFHLDDWINKIAWGEIRQDVNVDKYSKDLICQLYTEIQKKVMDTKLSPLDKLNLNSAKNKIQELFQNQPVELIEVIQNCLNQERLLLDSNEEDPSDRRQTEEDVALLFYRQNEEKVKREFDVLCGYRQKVEVLQEQFHTSMDQSIPRISDLNDTIRENRQRLATTQDQRQQLQINTKIQDAFSQMNKIMLHLQTQKQVLKENLLHGCRMSVGIVQLCWNVIRHYQVQQKHSVCFLVAPPEGAVDILNTMCEMGGQSLMSYLSYLDMVLGDVNRFEFQEDPIKKIFQQLQAEMGSLLEGHIKKVFLITRQPQNVVKIVQSKSPQLHMCLKFLGGVSLGLGHTIPYVNVRVYTEQKLKQAMEATDPINEGACKTVENGTNVPMTLKKPKDHIQANLNNMVLRGVERFEKKDKDERVTDYKYGVVCYTKVTVRNKDYPLKVLALPIVFTSQTSQEGPAKGTLLWDALSPLDRVLYEDPQHVKWEQMAQVLQGMFKETGLSLNEDQLEYIKGYVFGNAAPAVSEETQPLLTKDRFLRDKVRGCDFTYWMWLYACKNLIIECVNAEWKDKMIYGFIGRLEAEQLLKDKEPGTFLLRFRERKIEGSQKANKCAYLAIAVVGCDPYTGEKVVDHVKDHLTPPDIHKYGLTVILKSMVDVHTRESLLNTLYPDTDFRDIIQKYTPDNGDSSEGYSRTDFMIRVMNGRSTGDGSDCPTSPASTVSAHLGASSPDLQSDSWANIELDPSSVDFFQVRSPLQQHAGMMNTCDRQLSTINLSDFAQVQNPAVTHTMTESNVLLLGELNNGAGAITLPNTQTAENF